MTATGMTAASTLISAVLASFSVCLVCDSLCYVRLVCAARAAAAACLLLLLSFSLDVACGGRAGGWDGEWQHRQRPQQQSPLSSDCGQDWCRPFVGRCRRQRADPCELFLGTLK